MNEIINWLKTHWFIFTALVTGGIAWGQTITQVAELEKKVAKSELIAADQSRLDERTKIMLQDMKEQRQILIEMLATQRAWAQKNNIIIQNPAPIQTPNVSLGQRP